MRCEETNSIRVFEKLFQRDQGFTRFPAAFAGRLLQLDAKYFNKHHRKKQSNIIPTQHTSYLSRTPRIYSCNFFLAGVNFYRFNAKNWHCRQILREKVAFFGINFILQKLCTCEKNDKYQVCSSTFVTSFHIQMIVIKPITVPLLLAP